MATCPIHKWQICLSIWNDYQWRILDYGLEGAPTLYFAKCSEKLYEFYKRIEPSVIIMKNLCWPSMEADQVIKNASTLRQKNVTCTKQVSRIAKREVLGDS